MSAPVTRVLRHPLSVDVPAADLFARLHGDDTDVFWLDGGDSGTSYLGAGRPWHPSAPVLPAVREALAGPAPLADDDAPPFRLGLVGWLGYELRGETMGVPVPHASRYPDAAFLRVDRAVAVHPDGTSQLLALGTAWEGDLARWRDDTIARAGIPAPRPAGRVLDGTARWRDTESQYLAAIAACQAAIRDGDAYLLNLTTEVEVAGSHDPVAVYARLREATPSHHGGLLRIGGISLLSASPETFLEVEPDGTVRTRPVKGTRRRDPDRAADDALRDELRTSVKERAENVMIVDLMRNDLGRVSEVGSVWVPDLLEVETYRPVHQLVSTVQGRLRAGLDAIDAIEACLPAGSMTGAPKRRATELLDAFEGRARGLYAGAWGYLGLDGRADLAMVIRSIVMDGAGATIGVGGGITALSVPHEEVAEIRLKADALLRALGADAQGG